MNTKNQKYAELFVPKSRAVHGDKYAYGRVSYTGSKVKVSIECKKHGVFKQRPNDHLRGKGCPDCKRESAGNAWRLSVNEFIRKANEVHSSKYDYSLSIYRNMGTLVEIGCPAHGVFKMRPTNHIYGRQGCPKCGNERKSETSGWSKSSWGRGRKSMQYTGFKFYVLKCYGNGESFYKVGRTFRKLNQRFKKSIFPYRYKIYDVITIDSHEEIFTLENKVKAINVKSRYTPKLKFRGMGECYSEVTVPRIDNTLDYYIKLIPINPGAVRKQ